MRRTSVMRRTLYPYTVLWVLLLLVVAACPVAAQAPPGRSSLVVAATTWSVGLGYPEALSLGGEVAVGRSTSAAVVGRGFSFRGVELGAGIGLGAGTMRLSWADYFAYDAGREGWSVDAVLLRPWGLSWAQGRDDWLVGGGASWHVSYLRISAALTRSVSGGRTRVVPVLQGHLTMLPW